MAIIQVRVDNSLKEQAMSLFDGLGIDISTAIRVFLKKCIAENGIPFSINYESRTYDPEEVRRILDEAADISEKNGNSDMSLDEINEEIRLAREEIKKENE